MWSQCSFFRMDEAELKLLLAKNELSIQDLEELLYDPTVLIAALQRGDEDVQAIMRAVPGTTLRDAWLYLEGQGYDADSAVHQLKVRYIKQHTAPFSAADQWKLTDDTFVNETFAALCQ